MTKVDSDLVIGVVLKVLYHFGEQFEDVSLIWGCQRIATNVEILFLSVYPKSRELHKVSLQCYLRL